MSKETQTKTTQLLTARQATNRLREVRKTMEVNLPETVLDQIARATDAAIKRGDSKVETTVDITEHGQNNAMARTARNHMEQLGYSGVESWVRTHDHPNHHYLTVGFRIPK